jgi:hypothetical protein
VNYCLNALISKGSIEFKNFKNNQNKWAYLLTPQGIAEKTALTNVFLKYKMQKYQQLKDEIEALIQETILVKATNKDTSTAEVEVSING